MGCGFFAAVEEGFAVCWRIGVAEGDGFARGGGCGEDVWRGPETGAGEEVVFHAGTGQLFDVLIGEVVVEGGADVLVGEIDTADAFIVCGERDGLLVDAVEGDGVVVALDAENAFVGA